MKMLGRLPAELFGVGDDPLEHRRKAGGPRTRGAQRKAVALCNPLQCRVAVHDANSHAAEFSRIHASESSQHAAAAL